MKHAPRLLVDARCVLQAAMHYELSPWRTISALHSRRIITAAASMLQSLLPAVGPRVNAARGGAETQRAYGIDQPAAALRSCAEPQALLS
eukprot:6196562-Pleurochrysis_carterae.AAC.1